MATRADLLQGTLDLLILKTLDPRTTPRLGHLEATAATLERCARSGPGLALPGALSPRGSRLGHRGMEYER